MHGFTNQQNEFFALLFMLYTANNIGIKKLTAIGDSKLAIQSMSDVVKLKHSRLISIQKDIHSLSSTFEEIAYLKISSEKNQKAHNLAQLGARTKFDLSESIEKLSEEF